MIATSLQLFIPAQTLPSNITVDSKQKGRLVIFMNLVMSRRYPEHGCIITITSWHNCQVFRQRCSYAPSNLITLLKLSLRNSYKQSSSAVTVLFRHSATLLLRSWRSCLLQIWYHFLDSQTKAGNPFSGYWTWRNEELSLRLSALNWSYCPNYSCLYADNHGRTQKLLALCPLLTWSSSSNTISLRFMLKHNDLSTLSLTFWT